MKIGIVSNSKICLPLLSHLSSNKAGVMLYLGRAAVPDVSVNEMAAFCRARNIALHVEDNKQELYQWQQLRDPDVIFFTGYGHKVDAGLLSSVPKGIYNIHFGSLPQYKGPSPVFWQLKNGAPQLGLSIHVLTNKLDSGAIVWESNIKNEEYHTYSYTNQLFSELQVRGVFEIVDKLSRNQPLIAKEQDDAKAAYYQRPQPVDVLINWEKMSAREMLDLIKACTSWNNGASTIINGYELKILDAETALNKANNTPGTITIGNNKFNVACINNQALSINFFNINNTCIPARHAAFYGLKTGQQFISNL